MKRSCKFHNQNYKTTRYNHAAAKEHSLYAQSFILVDHSIGYIDSVTELSCLIHEFNTYHLVKIDNEKYGNALYFDTHGGGRIGIEIPYIQQVVINNNSALSYFDSFQSKEKEDNGNWLALITNSHANILYLKYYLDKLLV